MKTTMTIVALLLSCLAATSSCPAQVRVWHQGIRVDSVNLRGSPVVLGQQTINVSMPGDVVVRFDGTCVSSPGDRIVLAAGNTIGLGVNDAVTAVEAYDADVNLRCFSHSRVYAVPAGTHTLYALGENTVEQDGSGIAAIYGSLTVEFFPYGTDVPLVAHTGVVESNRDVRGASTVIAQGDIDVGVAGDVLVRFDGVCMSSPGDRILIAASNTTSWSGNDGTTAVEAIDGDLNLTPFCHSRMYPVEAGPHTFYGVAENFIETDGNGIASFYGSLTLEFFPDVPGGCSIRHAGVSRTNVDVRGAPVIMDQLTISPTVNGTALVTYEGLCVSSPGDRIVVAASDVPYWRTNDGNAAVEAVSSDLEFDTISHTRSYAVGPGEHTFYAVCENYAETDGSGIASNYASLSVQFVPDPLTAVEEDRQAPAPVALAQNCPNPFNPTTTIRYDLPRASLVTLEVFDLAGRLTATLRDRVAEAAGRHEVAWDGTDRSGRPVPSGAYLYRLTAGPHTETRRMVLVR